MNDFPAEPSLYWSPISCADADVALGYKLTNVCSLFIPRSVSAMFERVMDARFLPALDLRLGALGAARLV